MRHLPKYLCQGRLLSILMSVAILAVSMGGTSTSASAQHPKAVEFSRESRSTILDGGRHQHGLFPCHSELTPQLLRSPAERRRHC